MARNIRTRPKDKVPVAERLVYSIAEAAELLNLSERSAYAAAKRGEIPVLKMGSRMVVPKAALDAMLAGTPTAAA